MKKATKAALLSALVFPGCGHLALKRYVRGTLLTAVVVACLYIYTASALAIAHQVADRIQSGAIPLDPTAIEAAVEQAEADADSVRLDGASYLLGLCWLVGIADAWRIGHAQDRAAREGAGGNAAVNSPTPPDSQSI